MALFTQYSNNNLTIDTGWNSVTRDEIDVDTIPGFLAYFNGKAIAEREFWEIADQNPQVDFTTSKTHGSQIADFVVKHSY
jgi:hypothetical protein